MIATMLTAYISILLIHPSLFSSLHPSDFKAHDFRHNEQVAKLQHADSQAQLLLENIQGYLQFRKTVNSEDEAYLKSIGQWEQACQCVDKLEQSFANMHEKFLSFRESLAECISINDDYSPMACTFRADSIASFTDWYFHHVEAMIFPAHWDISNKCLEPYSPKK